MQRLFAVFPDKQEVIRHRIHMGQNAFPLQTIQERAHGTAAQPDLVIIRGDGRPHQALIEINLLIDIEIMGHRQGLFMELPQQGHAGLNLLWILRVAVSGFRPIGCQLIARLRVDGNHMVGDGVTGQGPVVFRFLTTVDELVRPLPRHPENILDTAALKAEGAVGHACRSRLGGSDLFSADAQGLLQLPQSGLQGLELLFVLVVFKHP